MRTYELTAIGAGLLCVALLSSCGGGAFTPGETMGVTLFSPGGPLPSETEQPYLIDGWGFGPVGDACPIRLTATTGTPFHLGQSATLDGPGRIEDEGVIRGLLAAAEIPPGTGPVTATVELMLPNGSAFPLEGVTVTFLELESALRVTSVSPVQGSVLGGYPVTLSGEGFARDSFGAPRVWFGAQEATVVLVADTAITCTAPAHPAGPVAVRVTSKYVESTSGDAFEYCPSCALDWDYGPDASEGVPSPDIWLPHAGGFEFPWYGVPTTQLHIGRWGNLEFGTGGSLCVLENELDTQVADSSIHCKQLSDRIVVTYNNIATTETAGRCTVQVILHESGTIAVMYANFGFGATRIGLQPSEALTHDDVDWTSEPSGHGSDSMGEQFDSGNPFDLVGYGLLFEPNTAGGYDTTLFEIEP